MSAVEEKSTVVLNKEGEEVGRKFRGGVTAILGETQTNAFTVTVKVDGEKRGNTDIIRYFNHEAGHSGGLDHPWENRDKVADINQNSPAVSSKTLRENLLNSSANPNDKVKNSSGKKITPGQFSKLNATINSQQPQDKPVVPVSQ